MYSAERDPRVVALLSSRASRLEESMRPSPGDRHVQALQRPEEPAYVQQHPRVSVLFWNASQALTCCLLPNTSIISTQL